MLLHANAGILLGAVLIVGSSVAGGVVAYQVAFVFFLAPYAVLAQPILTAFLPDLVGEVERRDMQAFTATVRGALDRMAVLVLPVSAVMIALALPMMRVVAFGRAEGTGVDLLAAALASLAIGLFPYGAFLLLRASYYALGDSRTPALVAVICAVVGVAVMVIGASLTDGAARVAALGIGHTAAFCVGALVLGFDVHRRVATRVWDVVLLRAIGVAIAAGVAAWLVADVIDPHDRLASLVTLVVGGAVALGVFVAGRAPRAPAPDHEAGGMTARRGAVLVLALLAILTGIEVAAAGPAHAADAPTRRTDADHQPARGLVDRPRRRRSAGDRRVHEARRTRERRHAHRSRPPASITDAYLTMGAGTRAVSDDLGSMFDTDEPYGDEPAGEVFRRRTGQRPDARVLHLDIAEVERVNDATDYDAEPGALGRSARQHTT